MPSKSYDFEVFHSVPKKVLNESAISLLIKTLPILEGFQQKLSTEPSKKLSLNKKDFSISYGKKKRLPD